MKLQQKIVGPALILISIALAIFQLAMFDYTIGHAKYWADGTADSWVVFTPLIDGLILATIILLSSVGSFLLLYKIKRLWLRLLISIIIGLIAWLAFFMLQNAIEQHISHYVGI